MRVHVRDTVGENAITLDDGQAIHDRIKPELAAGRQVDLDFEGVAIFASPFFNAAIGQLLKDLQPDDLNRLLRIQNLNAVGDGLMRRVIENAKRYYASPDYRAAQARILQEMFKEE